MSGLLAVLVFGVGYPIAAMVVACFGVFGIAATAPERHAEAMRRARLTHPEQWAARFRESSASARYASSTLGLVALVLFASCAWPVAIPIWLSWRKGSFIADALEKRDEQIRLDKAAS